jgi:hypothetical protein
MSFLGNIGSGTILGTVAGFAGAGPAGTVIGAIVDKRKGNQAPNPFSGSQGSYHRGHHHRGHNVNGAPRPFGPPPMMGPSLFGPPPMGPNQYRNNHPHGGIFAANNHHGGHQHPMGTGQYYGAPSIWS